MAPLARADETEVDVTEPHVVSGDYEFEMASSFMLLEGSFDPYGDYQPYPGGTSAWSWMTMIGGAYRFSERWEAAATIPIRHSELDFPTGGISSNSIGGVLAVAKFHVGGWPHLVLHAGVGTPWRYREGTVTGNPSASLPDDFDDSFPSGTSFPVGAGVSRSFGDFRLALDVSYTFLTITTETVSDAPPGFPPVAVQSGNRLRFSEGLSYEIVPRLAVNLGFNQMWLADTQVNGVDIPDTAGRVFSTSLGLSYSPNTNWRYTLTGQTPFPFFSFEANEIYGPGVSVQISYLGHGA